MLGMGAPFGLIARVYKSFMANKEITSRKGFGTDVAYKSRQVRVGLVRSDGRSTNGFSFVCVRI